MKHVTLSLSPATVREVLAATVMGSDYEIHVLQTRVSDLSPLIETMLLDAGYDDGALLGTFNTGALRRWPLCRSRLAPPPLKTAKTALLV